MTDAFAKRLPFLFSLLYVLACIYACVTQIANGDGALPVTVHLSTTKNQSNVNLSGIEVYRVSLNGNSKLLSQKVATKGDGLLISDDINGRYFQAIEIKLSNDQLLTLSAVEIRIGDKTFFFKGNIIRSTWKQVGQFSSQVTYQSPPSLSLPKTIFPYWSKAINWGFGWYSFGKVCLDRLPLLTLILVFLLITGKREQRWTSQVQAAIGNQQKLIQYVAMLSALITLYRFPFDIQPISSGLDPSWILGLNWANSLGMEWGRDVAFTYGPYYWLLYPNLLLDTKTLIVSSLVSNGLLLAAESVFVYYILKQVYVAKINLSIGIVSILTLTFFEYNTLDITSGAVVLLLTVNDKRLNYYAKILPVCIMLALLSLCKFSYLAVSICIVLLTLGRAIVTHNYKNTLSLIGTFASVLCVLWLFSGQSLTNLPVYVVRGYQITQGYSEAMATPIWNEAISVFNNILINILPLCIALFLLLSVVALLLIAIFNRSSMWFKLLITAPILFLAFKEGFIRLDAAHVSLFYAQLQIIALLYIVLYSTNRTLKVEERNLLSFFFVGLLVFTGTHPAFHYPQELNGLISHQKKSLIVANSKNKLRAFYSLDSAFHQKQSSNSFDIIPYDIALLYAYEVQWEPRPVFQSYSVYSTVLDSINANHFDKATAPQNLIFSFKTIDNRYPLFDEPKVVRELLTNYEIKKSFLDTYLLLEQKTHKASSRFITKPIQVSLNDVIAVPTRPSHYTYAHVSIKLTSWGRLFVFLFKVQPLYVELQLKDNPQVQRFRLVRQTTKDGLLVSSFADDLQSATEVLSGRAPQDVKSIRFIGDGFFYEQQAEIKYEFVNYRR